MPTKFICTVFTFCLLISTVLGGIRGPGEYAGVVIFDRWDTCYVYSGVYVMYIADKGKEALRKYSGQSVLVDATEVTQPMNPGDGLITKFKLLGQAKDKENLPRVQGLRLKAKQIFEPGGRARFELTIENQTDKVISVTADAIAPTLLGEKDDDDLFSPSDGKSDAKITRTSLKDANGLRNKNSKTRKDSNGRSVTVTRSFR